MALYNSPAVSGTLGVFWMVLRCGESRVTIIPWDVAARALRKDDGKLRFSRSVGPTTGRPNGSNGGEHGQLGSIQGRYLITDIGDSHCEILKFPQFPSTQHFFRAVCRRSTRHRRERLILCKLKLRSAIRCRWDQFPPYTARSYCAAS